VVAAERQDLRLIDAAIAPDKPVQPRRGLLSGTAALFVLVACFIAFLARDIYHMF